MKISNLVPPVSNCRDTDGSNGSAVLVVNVRSLFSFVPKLTKYKQLYLKKSSCRKQTRAASFPVCAALASVATK